MIPGFAPQTGFMPDVFYSELLSIYGGVTGITDVWSPEGYMMSGVNVEGWRGRKGNVATNYTTNRFETRVVDGQRCLYTNSSADKLLVTPTLTFRSIIAVASVPVTLTAYQTLVTGPGAGVEFLNAGGAGSTTLWYNPVSALQFRKNGELNNLITSVGLTVFEVTSSQAAITSTLKIGGSIAAGRTWLGDILMVLALPDNSSVAQRIRLLDLIARYRRYLSRYSGKLVSLRRGDGSDAITSIDSGCSYSVNAGVIPDAGWYWIKYDRAHNTQVAVANGSNYTAVSTDGGTTWSASADGTRGATTFCRIVYDEFKQCLVAVSEVGNICNYSIDGGFSWTQVAMGITEHAWFGLEYDPKNKTIVAISDETDNSTCRSVDGGKHWSAGGSLLALFNGTFCNVVCYDPDHERLVATNQMNKSAYSTDGGATWSAGGNLPASRQWDSLAYDTIHKRMLAVACSGTDRITAYSTDGGATWTQGGTIPGITTGFFRQLVCDPKLGRVIGPLYSSTPPKYICTDDGGVNWSVIEATGSTSASGTAMGIVPY